MYNPGMQSSYNFVPGIMGMIMIVICAMMTSVSIVREKENGTMEVLLVSPVKPLTVIISKMIPYFVISSINLSVILLLAKFVLSVPLSGSLFWTCVISIVYIILSLALGMLISTLVKTQAAAMLSSAMLLLLPVIMLSGMIFPIESEPHFFQWISMTVPARWYISAMRKLMVEGQQLHAVLPELGILSGMAVFLISVALFNLKSRLE
jgi:ABC-2 type transport system permease protein